MFGDTHIKPATIGKLRLELRPETAVLPASPSSVHGGPGCGRRDNLSNTSWLLVGAIGFEPTPPQQLVALTGLGWQPKDRNGSQRNNYWTRIGHCRLIRGTNWLERFHAHNPQPNRCRSMTERGKVLQSPQHSRNQHPTVASDKPPRCSGHASE
jgi:hypothetical protein